MYDYQARINKARHALDEWGADFLILDPGKEWFYFSGAPIPDYHAELKFPGDWASMLVIPRHDPPAFVVYETDAGGIAENSWIEDIRTIRAFEANPAQAFASAVSSLALDDKTIAIAKTAWSETVLGLRTVAPQARFIAATSKMLDELHNIKEPAEIEAMQAVAQITDEALLMVYRQLRPGMTLRDVEVETEYQLRKAGADGLSFKPGVVSFPLGKTIAERGPDTVIEPGMALGFDMGAVYRNYCSDFGRTIFVGQPDQLALDCYASLRKAVQSLAAVLGDGNMTAHQASMFVVESIQQDGFGEYHATPGLGHGIGLEAHEWPWLFPDIDATIRKGMCLAIEPKIHVPGKFYMRIEDNIHVKEDHSEFLTRCTYDPLVVE